MPGIILEGILIGLGLSIKIGSTFFFLINTSINKGFRMAAIVAVGIMCSDALCIVIALYNQKLISENDQIKKIAAFIGAGILVITGLLAIFKAPKEFEPTEKTTKTLPGNYILGFIKGIFVNTSNPFVFLFWLGLASTFSARGMSVHNSYVYFISILITVLTTDFIKAWLATKLKKLLNARLLRIVNILSGIILALIGIRLLFFAIHL